MNLIWGTENRAPSFLPLQTLESYGNMIACTNNVSTLITGGAS